MRVWQCNEDDYDTLKLLDNNFILYRYPTANRFYNEDMIDSAFQALINVNTTAANQTNNKAIDNSIII